MLAIRLTASRRPAAMPGCVLSAASTAFNRFQHALHPRLAAKTPGSCREGPESGRDFGAILMNCHIKLWGRWDSNPHCQRPKLCASCRLGYGPLLFLTPPANVGVCEWQFGQRKRRFSFLLSSQSPLI